MDQWQEGVDYDKGLKIERIAIRTPVWNGRQVGIATFRARRSDVIEVKVLYRLKESPTNKALVPKVLRMASSKVLTYPKKLIPGSTVEVCMTPIADYEEISK